MHDSSLPPLYRSYNKGNMKKKSSFSDTGYEVALEVEWTQTSGDTENSEEFKRIQQRKKNLMKIWLIFSGKVFSHFCKGGWLDTQQDNKQGLSKSGRTFFKVKRPVSGLDCAPYLWMQFVFCWKNHRWAEGLLDWRQLWWIFPNTINGGMSVANVSI